MGTVVVWLAILGGALLEAGLLWLSARRLPARADPPAFGTDGGVGVLFLGVFPISAGLVSFDALPLAEALAFNLLMLLVTAAMGLAMLRPNLVVPLTTLPTAAATLVLLAAVPWRATLGLWLIPWVIVGLAGVLLVATLYLATRPRALQPAGTDLGPWPRAIFTALAIGAMAVVAMSAGHPVFGFLSGYTEGASFRTMAIHGAVLIYGATQAGVFLNVVFSKRSPRLAERFSPAGQGIGPTAGAIVLAIGGIGALELLWPEAWSAGVLLAWATLPAVAGLFVRSDAAEPSASSPPAAASSSQEAS